MSTVFMQAACIQIDFAIFRNADWRDTLPKLRKAGVAYNLTGKNLVCYIRPDHDHTLLQKKLSFATGEITYPNPTDGQAAILVPRADVITELPVGTWKHHWVIEDASSDPDNFLQPFRGTIFVYAGSIIE